MNRSLELSFESEGGANRQYHDPKGIPISFGNTKGTDVLLYTI